MSKDCAQLMACVFPFWLGVMCINTFFWWTTRKSSDRLWLLRHLAQVLDCRGRYRTPPEVQLSVQTSLKTLKYTYISINHEAFSRRAMITSHNFSSLFLLSLVSPTGILNRHRPPFHMCPVRSCSKNFVEESKGSLGHAPLFQAQRRFDSAQDLYIYNIYIIYI